MSEQERELRLGAVAFDGTAQPDRGYTVKATYLDEPKGGALVEIFKDGEPHRRFLYPSYKVWNIAAHFADIVDSEIAGDDLGFALAGTDGLGGYVMPRPAPAASGGAP